VNTKQAKKEAAVHGHLMPPAAAAEYLGGIVVGTLAKWRHFGEGPEYVKIGTRVMYEQSALDAYIAARRCRSTSQAAA
jgi:Helix-turn-helix domain